MKFLKRERIVLNFGIILFGLLAGATVQASSVQCVMLFQNQITQTRSADNNSSVGKIRSYEASTTLSRQVRDNPPHYWAAVKNQPFQGVLETFKKMIGFAIGDAHAGNFVFMPFQKTMRLFVLDVKDAGQAPLLFDINRLILNSMAILKDSTSSKKNPEKNNSAELPDEKEVGRIILKHYLFGLKAEKDVTDYKLLNSLVKKYTVEDFLNRSADKVEGKTKVTKDGELRFRRHVEGLVRLSEVQHQRAKEAIEQVRRLHPELMIHDVAQMQPDRGGSVEQERIWVLTSKQVQDEKTGQIETQKIILEFKEVAHAAADQFVKPLSEQDRQMYIEQLLWNGQDENYTQVNLQGKAYWLRPRKIEFFSVPYRLKESNLSEFMRITKAIAYQIGALHRKQLNSSLLPQLTDDYVKTLENNPVEVLSALISFNKSYLNKMQEDIAQLQQQRNP